MATTEWEYLTEVKLLLSITLTPTANKLSKLAVFNTPSLLSRLKVLNVVIASYFETIYTFSPNFFIERNSNNYVQG